MFEEGKEYLLHIKKPDKVSFYHALILEISEKFIKIKDKFGIIRIINKTDIIEAELKSGGE
jgi:hypothetical protein